MSGKLKIPQHIQKAVLFHIFTCFKLRVIFFRMFLFTLLADCTLQN